MERGYLLIQTEIGRATHVRDALEQLPGVTASTVGGAFDVIAVADHPAAFRAALDACRGEGSVVRLLPCAREGSLVLDEPVFLDTSSAPVRRAEQTPAVP